MNNLREVQKNNREEKINPIALSDFIRACNKSKINPVGLLIRYQNGLIKLIGDIDSGGYSNHSEHELISNIVGYQRIY